MRFSFRLELNGLPYSCIVLDCGCSWFVFVHLAVRVRTQHPQSKRPSSIPAVIFCCCPGSLLVRVQASLPLLPCPSGTPVSQSIVISHPISALHHRSVFGGSVAASTPIQSLRRKEPWLHQYSHISPLHGALSPLTSSHHWLVGTEIVIALW